MKSISTAYCLGLLLLVGVLTTGQSVTPKVLIDGYTPVSSTPNSPATLPLGTTLILVCRLSGIPHGQQTTYTWTCPNTPCQQTGYAGRKINNNIIAINTTSTSDEGTYTCTVTAGGMEASQQFRLNVAGGAVVHSYGRLIFHERVITERHQLQPPNKDTGDGRIECTVSRGQARFQYTKYNEPNADSQKATSVIPAGDFSNFDNIEGSCGDIYHYLFLSDGTLPPVNITGTSSTTNSITVNIGTIPNGIARVIIGYHRLDLGQPVVGQYENAKMSETFTSLVPGAKYRITTWGLSGSSTRIRSSSPTVVEVTTRHQNPSPPRELTITRFLQHGIELNWIPPRETNGDIQHYIIKYTTQDGPEQEITTTDNTNYYNLTGLERGQTYNNIRVVAVNSAGTSGGSGAIEHYAHNPTGSTGTATESPTNTSNTDKNISKSQGSPAAAIAGAVVGVGIFLLLIVLVIVIVVLVIRHRKGAKSTYNNVTHHYEKAPDTKEGTAYYSVVGSPPGGEGSIVGGTVIPVYDDVDGAKKQHKKQGPGPYEYDDIEGNSQRVQAGKNTTDLEPTPPGYEYLDDDNTTPGTGHTETKVTQVDTGDLYTVPDKSKKSKIKKEKAVKPPHYEPTADIVDNTQVVGDVYAIPDKSTKKNKGNKDNKESGDQVYENTQREASGPLTDPELLYTVIDKNKKTKKK